MFDDLKKYYHQELSAEIFEKAKQIKLLILDVDGVLTDGSLIFDENGNEYKKFNSQDGFGLVYLKNFDIKKAIITGRVSQCTEYRKNALGFEYYKAGAIDKVQFLNEILEESGFQAHECFYMGDDLQDAPVMKLVGLSAAPQNAHPYVKEIAHFVTVNKGGEGAVREICDLLIFTHKCLSHESQKQL